tara:strand:- start:1875 stop:2897 length:1023 start_codon:yes stop_codon:yes gene_type:complete
MTSMQANSHSIALIIPHADEYDDLQSLLSSMELWTKQADEVIVIDSSKSPENLPLDFEKFCSSNQINLMHHQLDKLIYPGHARNIGVNLSQSNLIAFLDVKTVPTKNWLSNNFEIIKNSSNDGIWGKTIYKCSGNKQKIIRAATYGKLPIRTLPGSLINRHCFAKAGLFIESVRAGEDGDWFNRAYLHRMEFKDHDNVDCLTYKLSSEVTYKKILLKWYRNNSFASPLPYLKPHKDIYFYLVSILAVLIAYNWNNLFAAWDLNSVLYIPNITKITASVIFASYYLARSTIIPIQKGVKIKDLFPFMHFQVFALSFALDVIKITAFFISAIKIYIQRLKIR